MTEYDDFSWEGGNPLFGDWGHGPRASDPGVVFLGTPVGVPCIRCKEPIRPGDTGEFMRCIGTAEDGGNEVLPMHRECLLLGVVGHLYGFCTCNDFEGLTERQAGIEVARRVDRGLEPRLDRLA